ncbi:hypothetical protein [Halarcobacter bivalviorum]|uniref:hypothetical protein n=1 Tax=Halarcobacter bivalviorum TaxID=663364 RepID=UPI00100A4075|nr:hypothetical protein [Halarcobacter bivalviorum]RXK07155.1 hypothetical protein CRU97_03340 [Halarcobacter bivalviorum]
MKSKYQQLLYLGLFFLYTSLSFAETLENELNSFTTEDSGSEVRVFGIGQKNNDKTYSGLGLEYKDDKSQAGLEYGNDYQKFYGVYKYDLPNSFYIKGGLGYLKKEILFGRHNIDIKQYTLGTSVGWGDDKNYNIELGYIGNKLRDAYEANGYTNSAYLEALGQYELNFNKDWGTLEAMVTYQNSHVYHNNHSGMILEGAYYPIEDIRTFVKYNDALKTDENDYRLTLGVKYAFASKTWSPILSAQANTSNSVSYGIVYDEDIENDPLNNRDFFENQVGTASLKAQELVSKEFNQRLNDSLNPTTQEQSVNSTPIVPNTAPTGKSFSVNASYGHSIAVDLASYIDDADGDTLTVIYVGSGFLVNPYGLSINTATISGTIATLSISIGAPPGVEADAYLEYKVFDGYEYSPVYRITIRGLGI